MQNSMEFVLEGLIDKSELVQIMAGHWTGNRPLPEPMMTQFTDADTSPGLKEWIIMV